MSVPSAKGSTHVRPPLLLQLPRLAVQLPNIPLDAFRAYMLIPPQTTQWAYRAQIAFAGICYRPSYRYPEPYILTDLIAFVCLVIFAFRLEAARGQSRMTHLTQTFVIMAFHIATLFFTVMGKVITSLLLVAHSDVMTSQTSVIPPIMITVYVFHPFS